MISVLWLAMMFAEAAPGAPAAESSPATSAKTASANTEASAAAPKGEPPGDAKSADAKTAASKSAADARADAAPSEPEKPFSLIPYKVSILLSFAEEPAFPVDYREAIRHEIQKQAERTYGAAWTIEAVLTTGAEPPSSQALEAFRGKKDKVFWVRVGVDPADDAIDPWTRPIHVREYDVEFAAWGPPALRRGRSGAPLAADLFDLISRQFRPLAMVTAVDPRAKLAKATVKGMGLAPTNPDAPFLLVGRPFRAYRDFLVKDKVQKRVELPWTYLVFREEIDDGMFARFEVASAQRNPLMGRLRGRTRVLALALGMLDDGQTQVRFVSGKKDDVRPLIGFQINVRPLDQPTTINVGATDHRGQINLTPVRLSSDRGASLDARVLFVTVLAGRSILTSFPLVPGDRPTMTVRVQFDQLLTDVNGRILALQEEVVDVVAYRALLTRRLNRFAEKSDLDSAKKLESVINALPDKVAFKKKLADIKDRTEKEAKASDRGKLGINVDRLFDQTESLVAQYFARDKVSVRIDEAEDEGKESKGENKKSATGKTSAPAGKAAADQAKPAKSSDKSAEKK